MTYSIWEYRDVVCTFAGPVGGKRASMTCIAESARGAWSPNASCMSSLCWLQHHYYFFPPSTDSADVEGDALLRSYKAFFNCCQWYYSCDYRCTRIFHWSKDWSAWAWNTNLGCQGCSSSPTNVFLSLSINCSMKRQLSTFRSAQQNESLQVKEHLTAWMNCNWFLFWVQLASELSAGESCPNKLSDSCNLYH